MRELIESCDAEYSRGPPKIKERIQQKADEDYDGKIEKVKNFQRVVVFFVVTSVKKITINSNK